MRSVVRSRSSLPLLCSLPFFWASFGCGGGGGATGGGAGSSGSGSSGLAVCDIFQPTLMACLTPMSGAEHSYDTTGTVADTRAPTAADKCSENPLHNLGWGAAPDTVIELDLANGDKMLVSLAVPGFTKDTLAKGDKVSLKYSTESGLLNYI